MKKGPQLIRASPSSFQGRSAPVYCFEPGDCMEVDSLSMNYPSVCFSLYAAVISGEGKYQVKLYDLDFNVVQTKEINISSEWDRYFIAIRYDKGITKVRTELTFLGKGKSECALEFPQIEKGLSPSSPMEPGTSRPADNICYNLDPIDKYNERGTIAVQFRPNQWQSNMLLPSENRTVFSLVGIDGDAIIVCFSGQHKGALCLNRRINGKDNYEATKFFLGNDQIEPVNPSV
jgi:hypothetical protein